MQDFETIDAGRLDTVIGGNFEDGINKSNALAGTVQAWLGNLSSLGDIIAKFMSMFPQQGGQQTMTADAGQQPAGGQEQPSATASPTGASAAAAQPAASPAGRRQPTARA